MGYCGFVLQSGDCRLFMEVERGLMQFGQLALASAAQPLDASATASRQYSVKEVLDYVRGGYLNWSQIEERNRLLSRMSEEESMMRWSKECQDLWPNVMKLFQQDEFNRRHQELEKVIKEIDVDLHQRQMELAKRKEAEWLPNWGVEDQSS